MRFRVISVRVQYGSVRVNQFLINYACHAKTSNFIENFGSGMVRFGSIRFSGPLSGEHISDVELSIGSGRSIRISGLRSVLSYLLLLKKPSKTILTKY